jgi:hypothetical protein
VTSWVPDYSIEAPEGHVWQRGSADCPDCRCCTAALCDRARRHVVHGCSGSGPSDFDLTQCPCSSHWAEAIRAVWAAVRAEPDDVAAVEAGARTLHTEMTRPMSSPPAWEGSPYAAGYRQLVRGALPKLRERT